MFKEYTRSVIFIRRVYVVMLAVLLFPLVALLPVKTSLYRHLYQVWMKTDTKPVWMSEAEKAVMPLLDL